ncbi:MAG: Zn-ribbon domain-containing protein [Methanoculleaceae archaeon]
MPHKCTKCGREFEDGDTAILRGCPSCGGKKFLYIREEERHQDVLEERPLEEIARNREREVIKAVDEREKRPADIYEHIESVHIIGPGRYELNIERLAESDVHIVKIGNEEKYALDIVSMGRKQEKKNK